MISMRGCGGVLFSKTNSVYHPVLFSSVAVLPDEQQCGKMCPKWWKICITGSGLFINPLAACKVIIL